jgi:hypothetical protein
LDAGVQRFLPLAESSLKGPSALLTSSLQGLFVFLENRLQGDSVLGKAGIYCRPGVRDTFRDGFSDLGNLFILIRNLLPQNANVRDGRKTDNSRKGNVKPIRQGCQVPSLPKLLFPFCLRLASPVDCWGVSISF